MSDTELYMRIRFDVPEGLSGEKIAADLRKSLISKYGVYVYMTATVTVHLGDNPILDAEEEEK